MNAHELSWISKKFNKWKYTQSQIPIETEFQNTQTEPVEFKPEIILEENGCQTEEIKIEIVDAWIETEEEIIQKEDKNFGTDFLMCTNQEIQTDKLSEETKSTPEEKSIKSIQDTAKISRLGLNNSSHRLRESIDKNNFPCQIKRVLFSKNWGSEKENNASKSPPSKKIQTARPQILHKPEHLAFTKPNAVTSRQESQKREIIIFHNEIPNEEECEGEDLEIKFSIGSESSLGQSSENEFFTENIMKKASTNIKIPQFTISKTYNKRSSSHNMRYI